MRGWATFSDCERYRYTLHRRWTPEPPTLTPGPHISIAPGARVCFCLLNPSTADAKVLDPTLTRCVTFARRWGAGHMEVVNAFALRSTQPAALKKHRDPVGPDNDRAIRRAAKRADLVVIGWGAHATLHDRHAEVLKLLEGLCTPVCFATTQAGLPKHPLYLPGDNPVTPYPMAK
jgi:hypothetical protein